MSQIAQQDHLYFQVGDFSNLTDEEKAGLKEKVQNGTIADVILTDGSEYGKIIAYSRNSFTFYSAPDAEIQTVVFPG